MRPRVSVFLGLSLDGCIARADGSFDWLLPFQDPDDDGGFGDFLASVDALVMGRATWDSVQTLESWPYGELPVYVRTRRPLKPAPRHGERPVDGPLGPILSRLHAGGVRHVYLDGGHTVRDGLREGVVDEVTFTWVPHVLGGGRRLLDETVPEQTWELLRSRVCAPGLVQATWRVMPGP